MDKTVLNDFAEEKIKPQQIVGFIIKLIVLKIIYISCFCVLYGMGEYSFYPFSNYPKPLLLLFCLTVMILFAPLVYLTYKIKTFKKNQFNQVLIGIISFYSFIDN